MSSPTHGPGPDDAHGTTPQGQPGWGPPAGEGHGPPQGYGPGYGPPQGYGPGYGPPQGYGPPEGYGGAPGGQRPGQVTAAAVIGLVWGTLGALLGALGILGASMIDELRIQVSGFDVLLGILGIAVAAALAVGGAQVLRGRAPALLQYAAYVQAALWALGLLLALAQGNGYAGTGLLDLVVAALIVFLLRQPRSREYFAARGQSV